MTDERVALKLDRLTIRNFQEADAADFFEYRSDLVANTLQGYSPFTDIVQAQDYIARQKDCVFGIPGQWIQLGVVENTGNKLVGDIGVRTESYDVRIVEIGFTVAAASRRNGYAKEALTGLFAWLFEEKLVHRIIALTDTENYATINLLEGLAMRREGRLLKSFYNKGTWRNEYLYALLWEEWLPEDHARSPYHLL